MHIKLARIINHQRFVSITMSEDCDVHGGGGTNAVMNSEQIAILITYCCCIAPKVCQGNTGDLCLCSGDDAVTDMINYKNVTGTGRGDESMMRS